MPFKAHVAVLATAIGILSLIQQTKAATTERILYTFCSQDRCTDGRNPNGRFVADGNGNLYGTASGGGALSGTIFELSPRGHNKWKHKTLYTLCKAGFGCPEGDAPGGLILDKNGNLYGASTKAIFELTPRAHGEWALHILVNIQLKLDGNSVNDGLSYFGESTGAPYDGVSPLYGVSTDFRSGVAFELTPRNRHWRLKVIYQFCSKKNCADGQRPLGKLLVSQSNEIFGTTNWGGTPECGCGVVYELSPQDAPRKLWHETTLHSFCSLDNCVDGKSPIGSLVLDDAGGLIGTTFLGGESSFGTVFRVVPNGRHSVETVLYSFCPQSSCEEGGSPESSVVINSAGRIFGTTTMGGAFGYGTIFSLQDAAVKPIYSFCPTNSQPCPDGQWPALPLTLDANGNIFGATMRGGNAEDGGVVFELKP